MRSNVHVRYSAPPKWLRNFFSGFMGRLLCLGNYYHQVNSWIFWLDQVTTSHDPFSGVWHPPEAGGGAGRHPGLSWERADGERWVWVRDSNEGYPKVRNHGEGPRRGLIHDYEPSDGLFWSTSVGSIGVRYQALETRAVQTRLPQLITWLLQTCHLTGRREAPSWRTGSSWQRALRGTLKIVYPISKQY